MTKSFKIHSICVLKNEADIIGLCIERALQWSDHIILYDGNSTDGTWEVVRQMAKDDPRIIPWKQDGKPFQESLRAEVFNEFRHLAGHGDWWCHLDADEIYIDDPKTFLAGVLRPYDVVWGLFIEFYLTQADVESIDFDLPIDQLLKCLRYYRVQHTEPRFVRHRNRMVWKEDEGWPRHMGLSYPKVIRFNHYKYRSPDQIQRRLDTRRSNVERGFPGWEHARSLNWQAQIADQATLHQFIDEEAALVVDPKLLSAHRGGWLSRAAKYMLHGTGVWP